MVVVVQLLAAGDQAPRHEVARRVVALEVAVADGVAEAVDDAGRHQRHRHELHRQNDDAGHAEHDEVGDDEQDDAEVAVAAVDVPLEPVLGRAAAVLREHLGVARRLAIDFGAFEQDLLEAEEHGAVRIARDVRERVVLAVHRDPLAGDHARGRPDPEPEEVPQHRVQVDRAVRRVAMQVEGHGHHRDLHQDERDEHVAPEAEVHEAIQEVEVHLGVTPCAGRNTRRDDDRAWAAGNYTSIGHSASRPNPSRCALLPPPAAIFGMRRTPGAWYSAVRKQGHA